VRRVVDCSKFSDPRPRNSSGIVVEKVSCMYLYSTDEMKCKFDTKKHVINSVVGVKHRHHAAWPAWSKCCYLTCRNETS